jgi:predicted membrane-bound spermidine synthase
MVLISIVFLFSGFSALLYQMVWQRKLFTIYGSNIESITVVVTAFMMGLGLGSLFGGWLSKRPKVPLLIAFALIELGIGAYGMLSIPLFDWIGGYTLVISVTQTGLLAFALVLVPTLLMGATLPLLVAHLVLQTSNVGRSVGALYFINTLGAAVGSFASVLLLFSLLGLSSTVLVAAGMNVFSGTLVLLVGVMGRRAKA